MRDPNLTITASRYEFAGLLRERVSREAGFLENMMPWPNAEDIDRFLGSLDTWRQMAIALAPDGYVPKSAVRDE